MLKFGRYDMYNGTFSELLAVTMAVNILALNFLVLNL